MISILPTLNYYTYITSKHIKKNGQHIITVSFNKFHEYALLIKFEINSAFSNFPITFENHTHRAKNKH